MDNQSPLAHIQRLLSFPWRAPDRGNRLTVFFLLSFANMIVPFIPMFFLSGYCAEIKRRIVTEDEEPSLPPWDDFGGYFVRGLRVFAAGFLYMLPGLILLFGGYALLILPVFILPFAAEGMDLQIGGLLFSLSMFGGWFAIMLGFPLMMLLGAITPVITTHVSVESRFAAAFEINKWFPILRRNLGGFLLAFAILTGIFYILYFLLMIVYMTVVLCLLVPFLMTALVGYIMLVSAPLMAYAYKDGQAKVTALEAQREVS